MTDDDAEDERKRFNDKANDWLAANLGEPFVSYHTDLRYRGITVYDTCSEEDLPSTPTDEHVRAACLAWARTALFEENAKMLLSTEDPGCDHDLDDAALRSYPITGMDCLTGEM